MAIRRDGHNLLASDDNTRNRDFLNQRYFYNPIEYSSESDYDDQESYVSDCESGTGGGSNSGEIQSVGNGLCELNEENALYKSVKRSLIFGLGDIGIDVNTKIENIHMRIYSGFPFKARTESFGSFVKAMENKCGGDANMMFAWYGGSKDAINKVLSDGFSHCSVSNVSYGSGVYLSPEYFPLASLRSAAEDENGLRHLLLCKVLLGRMELVQPGSQQTHPTSNEYDTGVDNLESPRKYIVWSTNMNSHILPQYVVTIRAPLCSRVPRRIPSSSSPWMTFPALISAMAKFLSPFTINLIEKHHQDYGENKITRHEFIRRMRRIAGDDLLTMIIKGFKNKETETLNLGPPSSYNIGPPNNNCRCIAKLGLRGGESSKKKLGHGGGESSRKKD